MKSLAYGLAVTLALAIPAYQPVPAAANNGGILCGTVFYYAAGERVPVSNGYVTAKSPTEVEQAQIGANGHYCFLSLSVDSYVVTPHGDGFTSPGFYDVVPIPGESVTLDIPSCRGACGFTHIPKAPNFWLRSTSDEYLVR